MRVAEPENNRPRIGATFRPEGRCDFAVWAPERATVELRLHSPEAVLIPLAREQSGYWRLTLEDLQPGTLYTYRLDGSLERPDPASHSQPQGVHGPSHVVDHHAFHWQDGSWRGPDSARMILYEIHTGAFTPEGTFDAIIPRLKALRELGINTLQIMPVASFAGERNWGYDGVYPFAVHDCYGGPEALKRLVNCCHRQGMAVILDVVYNHLGPEGNYLRDFGPYFTGKYQTHWGQALNFDDAYSDEVRNFFIQNALFWFSAYHIDGLRLDAVHAIFDMSARPFLRELAEAVDDYSARDGKKRVLIAESDQNDARLIAPAEAGGYGLQALYCDDFHHSVHALITGEGNGYYADFGRVDHLVQALRGGFVYSGVYSGFRKRRHGSPADGRRADQFVVFCQNHDQVGNRRRGERLSQLVDFESLKLSLAVVLLSPFTPLLFMGEEYGETAPFLYFISHGDRELNEAVREGRKREFSSFSWQGEVPDPCDTATFLASKIHWEMQNQGEHKILREFAKTLIALRRTHTLPAILGANLIKVEGWEDTRVVVMQRRLDAADDQSLCLFNFNNEDIDFPLSEFPLQGVWRRRLDSSGARWGGGNSHLPEKIFPGQSIVLRRRSAAVYLQGELT